MNIRILFAAAVLVLPAAAQSFQCKATADAPFLRAGGRAELLGEIRLDCSGDTGSGAILADLGVLLPANYSGKTTGNRAEALLIVGDPAVPALGENVYQATLSDPLELRFTGVRLPSPGTGNLKLRIVNIRIAAPHVITTTPDSPGYQLVGLSTSFPLDTSELIAGCLAIGHRLQVLPSAIRFDEGFANAFRIRNVATTAANPTALAPQADYGRNYGTETGFYLPSLADVGLATQGTRITAQFANLPPGATVAVSYAQATGSTPGAQARLLEAVPDSAGMVSLPVTNGTARATWEVFAADPAAFESLQFTVLSSASNIAITSQFTPDSRQEIPDASSPVPRFLAVDEISRSGCGANCLALPAAIAVTYTQGDSAPEPIVLPIRSTGAILSWQAVATPLRPVDGGMEPPDGSWLSLVQTSTITPASLTVRFSVAALAPGVYPARITVSAGRFSQSVLVLLTVRRNPAAPSAPLCAARVAGFAELRNTGVTERLGDVLLACDSFAAPVLTDLRLQFDTTITSRPNDVLLLVNDPAPSAQSLGVNVFRAERVSETAVQFRNVTVPPSATLRVVNVYLDASRPRPRFANRVGLIASSIRASALNIRSISGNTAQAETAQTFQLRGTGAGWALSFSENLADVFRRRNTSGLSPQNVPGFFYNTETGFYNPALPNAGGIDMGLASQGTRLLVRFSGVPAGVTLSVSANEIGAVAGSPRAQRVLTDVDGAGPYQPITTPLAPVPLSAGSGVAVWEVLASDFIIPEELQFTLQVSGGAYVPSVEGFLAPLSRVDTADSSAPLPRFVTAPATRPPCPSFPCLRLPSEIILTSTGGRPATATVNVASDGGPTPFLVSEPAVPWLRLTPAAGVTPASFTLTAVPDARAAGVYTTTLVINGALIPVTFNVGDPGDPALLPLLESFSTFVDAGTGFAPISIPIGGTTDLRYLANSNASWLRITSGGVVPLPATGTIDTSLPPGTYEAVVTFTSPSVPAVYVGVLVTVRPPAVAYAITGTITNTAGAPLPGVTVTLAGSVPPRTVTTDASGVYTFSGLPSGEDYQVTPSSGSASFSPAARRFATIPLVQVANFTLARGYAPTLLSATQTGPRQFTVRASDFDGSTNFNRIYFLVNTTPAIGACHGYYDRLTNAFYLFNDALTAVLGPLLPGSTGVIENSRCQLQGATSSRSFPNFSELEVNFGIVRKDAFAAIAQKAYFLAQDNEGNDTGWVYSGPLAASGSSAPVFVSAIRAALPEGVRFTFSDFDGLGDITRAYFLLNDTSTIAPNTCHGFFDFSTRAFYLYDDSLTTLLGPLLPATPGLLENSQCAIDGSASAAATPGEITLAITRLGNARKRAQRTFVWIADRAGLGTGWVDTGLSSPALGNAAPAITAPVSSTPGPGQRVVGATLSDPDSIADLSRVYFLVNASPTVSTNSCHGFYDRPTRSLYLYNDSLTVLTGPLTPSASGTIENSQCRLQDLRQSTYSLTSTGFQLDFMVTRLGASSAANTNVYFWATDAAANGTGWVPIASWLVNNPPTVPISTPAALTGLTQTFSFPASDPDGAADLNRLYFLINPTPTVPANTCHGFYDRPRNAIFLYNDALSALLGPLTPGGSGTLQNGQCVINAAATSVATAGTTVNLNLNLTLTGALAAVPQNAYLWAVDNLGNGTGWVRTATWTARAPNQPPAIVYGRGIVASGSPSTITFTATDPNGYADIDRIYFQIGATAIPQVNGCHGFYDRAAGAIFLYNDALTALTPSLQNGQCAIDATTLQISNSTDGLNRIVSFRMSLKGALAAAEQVIWLWAVDSQNAGTGWQNAGSWLVNANRPPGVLFSTPNAATGSPTFSILLSDSDGHTNISRVYFLVANSPTIVTGGCHGFYDRASNTFQLYNDALTAFAPGLQNSQCAVVPPLTPFSPYTTRAAEFLLSLAPRGAFLSAPKTVFVWVVDEQGNGSGWIPVANWF